MPIIRIDGNNLPIEKKKEYFKEITDITAKYMDVPTEAVTIVYTFVEHEDIGVGGKLLSERLKE